MKSKERFCYIFAICVLVSVIALLVFLYLAGLLYASNISQVSNIPINSTVTVEIQKNEASAISFDVSGGLIPGEQIPENINIKNQAQTPLFLRSKAYVYTTDAGLVEIGLNANENWLKNEDGYYYFSEKIEPNQTIALANKIILNESYSFTNKERYIINILVESLDGSLNMQDFWTAEAIE